MKDKVSIIIVTYNSDSYIGECLRSIKKETQVAHEIVIVDNNSSDKTVDEISKTGIDTKLLLKQQNLGFAKANNFGVDMSSGNYLMFLNSDTVILDEAIDKLYQFLKDNKDVGIIAPKLLRFDNTVQSSVRRLPTLIGVIKEYYLGLKNSYEAYIPKGNEPTEVEGVVAAAIMVRSEEFKSIGGFDEKYFMYYEDLDLCKKVRERKLKVIFLPNATIKHKVGGSAEFNPQAKKLLQDSARIYHGRIIYYLIYSLLYFKRFVS